MFGAMMNTTWTVTYVKDSIVYYLAEILNDGSKYVWSTKKDKAKKYTTHPSANDMAETVKKTRKNKKQEINVTQV